MSTPMPMLSVNAACLADLAVDEYLGGIITPGGGPDGERIVRFRHDSTLCLRMLSGSQWWRDIFTGGMSFFWC